MHKLVAACASSLVWIAIAGSIGCAAEETGNELLENGFTGSGGASGTAGSSASGGSDGVSPSGGSGGVNAPRGGASGASGIGGAAGVMTAGMGGAGSGGVAPSGGSGGGGSGGVASGGSGGSTTGGAGGMAGPSGEGGSAGTVTGGECCPSGDCLCHGPDPSGLTTDQGSYDVDTFELPTGTVYYPTDAEAPLAAVAICPGFLNSGPEMADWGPFYASHGIVMIAVWTIGSDIPEIRAIKLLAAIDELKAENVKSTSPLFEKLAGRYGTSGYSMGGGGTTIATTSDATLRTSIGLAAWGPVGTGITTPTLLLCGDSDGVAPCFGSQDAYNRIPETTPKMLISISGATHFSWFGPQDAGFGTSGSYALAFQKVFLEGDERWRPFLLEQPARGTQTTNITP